MDIPNIGFGTYRLGKNTKDSVRHAINIGYRHIDTAPLYKNEAIVGNAINKSGINRQNLFITTKISRKELETNSIAESIENSLKNMGMDYLDLVLLHEPIDYIKNWVLLTDYYNTIGKNKVRFIGVSNFNEKQLKIIYNVNNGNNGNNGNTKPYCNQIELNPFLLRNPIVEYCNRSNIKIVAHSPLTKGEKLEDSRLKTLANEYNITPAQLMLKWNLQQNNIVIPRSKNNSHIEENLKIIDIIDTRILDEDMTFMESFDCRYTTHPKYL